MQNLAKSLGVVDATVFYDPNGLPFFSEPVGLIGKNPVKDEEAASAFVAFVSCHPEIRFLDAKQIVSYVKGGPVPSVQDMASTEITIGLEYRKAFVTVKQHTFELNLDSHGNLGWEIDFRGDMTTPITFFQALLGADVTEVARLKELRSLQKIAQGFMGLNIISRTDRTENSVGFLDPVNAGEIQRALNAFEHVFGTNHISRSDFELWVKKSVLAIPFVKFARRHGAVEVEENTITLTIGEISFVVYAGKSWNIDFGGDLILPIEFVRAYDARE